MGFEHDSGFKHGQRRGIGRGFGAAYLAKHAGHLGHGFNQAVGLLQDFGGLTGTDTGQCRWHVEQIAFFKGGHKLTTHAGHRIPSTGQRD